MTNQSSPENAVPIPLADHDEIGRKVLGQPWAIQSAVVTIAAHCRVLVDKHPTGEVADLAGCISHDCLELANALARHAQPQLDEIARLTPYVEAFRREEARADKLGTEVDELREEVERLTRPAQSPLERISVDTLAKHFRVSVEQAQAAQDDIGFMYRVLASAVTSTVQQPVENKEGGAS